MAETKDVNLSHTAAPDLLRVNVDPERIEQAIFNLLENAVRHTPAGGVVSIQCSVASKQSSVIISDNWSNKLFLAY